MSLPKKNPSAKLIFDRFMKDVRLNLCSNTHQNEREATYNLFKQFETEYVLTKQPKRDFFKDKNHLGEKGVKVYYRFNEYEKYEKFKSTLFKYFASRYRISMKRYPQSNGIIEEGYVLITVDENLKKTRKKVNEDVNVTK